MPIAITMPGKYLQDPSGLYHHEAAAGVLIGDFAVAVINRPAPGPAWFWFNGTPAPIVLGDTADTLTQRWSHWRSVYQRNPQEFMLLLGRLPRMEV